MFTATLNTEELALQCERRGLSVPNLAERMGISESTCYRVLRNENLPSNTFIAGLAVVFGTDRLSELLHFGDETTSAPQTAPRGFAPVSRARRHSASGGAA